MLRNPMRPAAFLALIAVIASPTPCVADPVELATFIALARPAPTAVLQYGPNDSQAADLFLPSADGPHPLAILIHGGCWSVSTAGREQLRHIGAELASRGIAVWSIGYRRANEPGGGYPGTFQDVGAAIDRLRSDAPRYGLDLSRTVLVGHSAGGHLALWAAVRDRLPASSPIYRAEPLLPRSVISLAGSVILKHSLASCRSSAGRELSSDWPQQRTRPIDLPRFRRRPCRQRAFRS